MPAVKKPQTRTLNYDRSIGLLTLKIGKTEQGYWLDHLDAGEADAIAVRLTPFMSQKRDNQPDSYDLVCRSAGGSLCECWGFIRHKKCKHLAAVEVLIARRML